MKNLSDERNQFSSTEIASILLCMYIKSKDKRDLSLKKLYQSGARMLENFLKRVSVEDKEIDVHLVGSIAEGLNDIDSDVDFMLAARSIFCSDADFHKSETYEQYNLADTVNASPGYVLLWGVRNLIKEEMTSFKPLKYINEDDEDTLIEITSTNGRIKEKLCMGEHIFTHKDLTEQFPSIASRNGPAMNLHISPYDLYMFAVSSIEIPVNQDIVEIVRVFEKKYKRELCFDGVFALPFRSETILRAFINRRRRYDWPTKSLLDELEHIPAYVVPVGKVGSRFEDKEWRISYTLTEQHLIKSLNKVQAMLLCHLKKVAKAHLLPISPAISSYVIKNLFLWMVECCPADYFKYEDFISIYKSYLVVLKERIMEERLPNYLMPERNLFEGKFEVVDKTRLLEKLDSLIKHCLDVSSLEEIYTPSSREEMRSFQDMMVNELNESERSACMMSYFIRFFIIVGEFVPPISLAEFMIGYFGEMYTSIYGDMT